MSCGPNARIALGSPQVWLKLARGESNENRNKNRLPRVGGVFLLKSEVTLESSNGRHSNFFWLPDQCDISTGTVIDRKMLRVTPPRMNSRKRECP